MKTLKELQSDVNKNTSLSKLVGKKVIDLTGYVSGEFGFPVFKITDVVFDDGTIVDLQGEHDIAFVPQDRDDRMPPNMDEQSLSELYELENGEPFFDGE